ncbi:glycosyltransferase family 52 [Vibrio sp. Vb1554]|uniref:glycosyltransferase family 52 n=1 Tax=unclassified Vibrio TaxID=2614977 RepID=UPI000E50FC3C|nr:MULTISPECIES: glycosyltransferase family 52 [unclassified Vibrio]AXT69684.1 hypothetical protein DBX26_00960 [Vibrio sp. dhg]MDW3048535.1 glycosyltransferase family 52 [Vibrio sp. Vb1554]
MKPSCKKLIVCRHSRDLLISLTEYYLNDNSDLLVFINDRLLPKSVVSSLMLSQKGMERVYFFDESIKKSKNRMNYGYNKVRTYLRKSAFLLRLHLTRAYKIAVIFSDADVEFNLLKLFSIQFWLFEHGTVNYLEPKKPKLGIISYFRKLLFYREATYGYYTDIDKIFLFNPDHAPKSIRSRVYNINLKEKFGSIDLNSRMMINSIFNQQEFFDDTINNCTVLVTQPLSEDGIISMDKKLSIYKDIVSQLKRNNEEVVIKPHPREDSTVYGSLGVKVLSNVAPFELYELNGVRFKKIVTIYSSVCETISYPTELTFLGIEYSTELRDSINQNKPAHSIFTSDYFKRN